MGMLSGFVKGIAKGLKKVVTSPIVSAATSFLPGGSLLTRAIASVSQGVSVVASYGKGTSDVVGESGSIRASVTPAGKIQLTNTVKEAALVKMQSAADSSQAIIESRKFAASKTRAALSSRMGEGLTFSDDLIFSAITKVGLGRTGFFAWVKNYAESSAGATAKDTNRVLSNASTPIEVAGLNSLAPGVMATISAKLQSDFRAFFNTKSVLEINPVISIISRLQQLTATIDNPFDFFGILGYDGPEVVNPIGELNSPFVHGLINTYNRHKCSKSLVQWFQAVSTFSENLRPYRKIVADWLGSEASNFPPFLLDMLSFYILQHWGSDLLGYLYGLYGTRETVGSCSLSDFQAMHIYDKYDTAHYMQIGALSVFDRVNDSLPVTPTDAQMMAYYIAAHQVVTLTYVLQIARDIQGMTSFGLDSEDITELHTSLTNGDVIWTNMAALCDKDNADILVLDMNDIAELIAEAELAAAELTIVNSDEIMNSIELEAYAKSIDNIYGQFTTLSDEEKAQSIKMLETMIDSIQLGLSENKVENVTQAQLIVTRLSSKLIEMRRMV